MMAGFVRLLFALSVLAPLGGCVTAERQRPAVAAPESAQRALSPPHGPADFIMIGDARQGGVIRGTVPAGTRTLTLGGVVLPVDRDGQFLIAFDRDAPEEALLQAEREDGSLVARRLLVARGHWKIEYVNASPTGGVTSEEFRARRTGELERINAARATGVKSDGWRQSFRWPLTGRVSGAFGSQRIYRGTPGSYHSGVDVAAAKGTPFVAPADGMVVLAADQPFTLEGHLLIIDHGMGLSSSFLHCSSLAVKEGERVRQGQLLGTVGASGRTTGPHLHWGMKWRDTRLDPMLLAGPIPAG